MDKYRVFRIFHIFDYKEKLRLRKYGIKIKRIGMIGSSTYNMYVPVPRIQIIEQKELFSIYILVFRGRQVGIIDDLHTLVLN